MMTGEDYKKSLDDGRATYFEGTRIEDLAGHPLLGQTVDIVAQSYDRFYKPEADAVSDYMSVPGSAEELRARMEDHVDLLTHVTYASIMTLLTAADQIGDVRPEALSGSRLT